MRRFTVVQVVVINGMGGVGKDAFVKACMKAPRDIYNLSMIDDVKNAALAIGWDGKKDKKGRTFLSNIKDALAEYRDYPYYMISERIKAISKGYRDKDAIIFVHAREAQDIVRLVTDFNAFVLLIRRPSVENEQVYTNHADLDVLEYHPYNYIYWNVGDKEKLEKDAKDFLHVVDFFGEKYEGEIDE